MNVAKFKIDLTWKEFNVSLDAVHAWLKANAGSRYCGTQAHTKLEVWFNEKPEASVIEAIHKYWEKISAKSKEAKSYISAADHKAKIESLKQGILSKDWSEMSLAERKLVMGMTPTNEELGLGG